MAEKNWPYEDIVHLSRPVSARHRPMSAEDRAAQFSAFAALTGYDAVIAETGRLTGSRVELAEDALADLDRAWQLLTAEIARKPSVRAVYFQPDAHKSGGAYVTVTGRAVKADQSRGTLYLEDGTAVALETMIALEVQ